MNKTFSRIICFVLLFSTFVTAFYTQSSPAYAHNVRTTEQISEVARGIINWKKLDNGSTPDGNLINNTFLELAGTTPGDWYPIGLGRLGIADDYAGYLAVIKDNVEKRYREKGKLHPVKATEWHRISLAVLAMGGDPTSLGVDASGAPINLIADGTYDRGKTTSLGRQGINGWIWGLISLDSKRYAVPQGAYYSRDDIIVEILKQQLSDGGFALTGKTADTDITAMALQSLAPYYNSTKAYSYTQRSKGITVTKTVRQVVDESLACLSVMQTGEGDYKCYGMSNVESTCQVVVALCSLGIDPQNDARFIKNGKTLVDGIMKYRMADGGFVHSYVYDSDNPTSHPDRSNTMASEQTLYTLAAIERQQKGQRTLYDFRPEQSSALKSQINSLKNAIAGIRASADKATVTALINQYNAIPESERCYVSNFWKLHDIARTDNIVPDRDEVVTGKPSAPSQDGTGTVKPDSGKTDDKDDISDDEEETDISEDKPLLYFTQSDRDAVDALPEKLTTENYVAVIKLLDKLEACEDFEGKDEYLTKLRDAKARIVAVQEEIDSINKDVLDKLYPFDKLSLSDKKTIDSIVKRYNALSGYDRQKIDRWEDVIKAKTKVDNELRAIIISVCSVIVIGVTVFFVIKSIKKRKRAKALAMEELASEYGDEE